MSQENCCFSLSIYILCFKINLHNSSSVYPHGGTSYQKNTTWYRQDSQKCLGEWSMVWGSSVTCFILMDVLKLTQVCASLWVSLETTVFYGQASLSCILHIKCLSCHCHIVLAVGQTYKNCFDYINYYCVVLFERALTPDLLKSLCNV